VCVCCCHFLFFGVVFIYLFILETHEKRTASLGGGNVTQQKKPKSGKISKISLTVVFVYL